jgi:hypothetical protein
MHPPHPPSSSGQPLPDVAQRLIRELSLAPHPEGGWYREIHRSSQSVLPEDGRPPRAGLTTIDFLLARGERSAWHRVQSDEAWHLLAGGPLTLWLMPPTLERIDTITLDDPLSNAPARLVVPAGWWQAAEPAGAFAYVGATVGPGFDFDDFSFGRDDAPMRVALAEQSPGLQRLL